MKKNGRNGIHCTASCDRSLGGGPTQICGLLAGHGGRHDFSGYVEPPPARRVVKPKTKHEAHQHDRAAHAGDAQRESAVAMQGRNGQAHEPVSGVVGERGLAQGVPREGRQLHGATVSKLLDLVEASLRDAANALPNIRREILMGKPSKAGDHAYALVEAARKAHEAALEAAQAIAPGRTS